MDKQLTAWERQARNHWKEFRPTMYAEMIKTGTLESSLKEAAQQTSLEMTQQMESGLYEWEAWEAVRQRYLFLPEEVDSLT